MQLDLNEKKIWKNTLGHFAISLNPFTEEDQLKFLVNFWETVDGNKSAPDDKRLNGFAQNLINLLAKSINDSEKSFTGIPLQCMMLAETFQPKSYVETVDGKEVMEWWLPHLPEQLPLIELYDRFWKTKLDLYHLQKGKVDKTNNYSKLSMSMVEKVGRRFFQRMAITLMFDEKKITEYLESGNPFG